MYQHKFTNQVSILVEDLPPFLAVFERDQRRYIDLRMNYEPVVTMSYPDELQVPDNQPI